MFGLFGNSGSKLKVIDKVWMSKEAKWNACKSMMHANPACVFIAWFEDTHHELSRIVGDGNVQLAAKIDYEKLRDRMVVFAEHYPLPEQEQALFKTLGLKEIPVTSSLDEPLFKHFGGERLIETIKKLGMKEDEVIGHSFITSAIRNAQEKLERKVRVEKPANSAEQWFVLNASSLN
jgi:hypothetical protein